LETNFEIIGEGKPLRILHGWGSCSERWRKVGELLAKKGLRVIIPDLAGFGKSQKPFEAWDLNEYCGFIQEFVEFLNLENFYLLGHSFGGAIAVKCSLKCPEKIEKLFLVGAACIRRKTIKKKLFYILAKFFKIFSFFPGYSTLKKGFYRFIVGKSDYLQTEGIMRDIYLKVTKEDLSDILPNIQVPTIIIWGEKDDVTRLKEAHLINKKIKNSQLEILQGLNHDLNVKAPEKLSEAIKQFLIL